jgi:ABC-type multidrug transport system fused ATPase/permease subunit
MSPLMPPPTDDAVADTLPVATPGTMRTYLIEILKSYRRPAVVVIGCYSLATVAGLVGPHILGNVVADVASRHRASDLHPVDVAVTIFVIALIFQSGFTRFASRVAGTMTSRILSAIRIEFVDAVLAMPVGTVEAAGTGELQNRASSDVEQLTWSVRSAAPRMTIAIAQTLLTVAALLWTAPVLGLVLIPTLPVLAIGTRWYLKRARPGYKRTIAAYDKMNARVQENAAAGRTIETFGLQDQRAATVEADIRRWIDAERYTLGLRTVYFPISEACYVIPLVLSVAFAGILHSGGHLSIAAATAAVLYVQMLIDPVDTVLSYLDEVQLGGASLSRLLGVREVKGEEPTAEEPIDEEVRVEDLHFAYRAGHDVLRGIDLAPARGSRVAVVGPSGAGKSTLALLLTGVHPPRRGHVRIGGVDAHRLPTERLREEVALVTQEFHIFNGTLRDNLEMVKPGATDDDLMAALAAVEAESVADRLPEGLDTVLGVGSVNLSPSEAQQVALARLVLSDPHTLVLDEATALLDPRAARHLERSLSRVLEGRTVIAVAHRLQSAFDADEIAVVDGGQIIEYGTHADLLAAGGSYASLWRSWQGQDEPASA